MAKEAKHKTIEENSNRGRKRVAYAVLIFLTFACLIWFVMLFLLTTQSHGEQFGSFKFMIGKSFFDNISGALNTQNMIRGMINSVIISGSCAILGVYFSTLTAYAIHAYDFKGKKFIFTFILFVIII